MNFCRFVEVLSTEIGKLCGNDAEIRIQNVTENNGVVHTTMNILKKGETISPVVHLDAYYKNCLEGNMSMEGAVRDIYNIFMADELPVYARTSFEDFEKIRDRVIYQLVDYGRNRDMLGDMPYICYCDLAVIFCLLLGNDSNGRATIKIHNEHMRLWDVDVDTLYDLAKANTSRLLPPEIKSLKQVIMELAGAEYPEIDSWDDIFVETTLEPNYVLTNRDGFKGAGTILYEGVLKEFAQRAGCDLVILPSSVHEVLLMPYRESVDAAELGKMVRNVNMTNVPEEDVLSDNVYLYSREKDQVIMIYRQAAGLERGGRTVEKEV